MSFRSPPSPARSHLEAMHRLLRLGTIALALLAAVQAGRLIGAARPTPAAGRAVGLSLDLSPSAHRETLDRRFPRSADGRQD